MQISLRSHLVAGVAAVVGAGVVTIAPATQMPALPSAAAVALAGFDNPIEEIIGTVELVQNYLLADYFNGADIPTPGAGEANWPGAGFDQTGGNVLNYLLAQEKSLGRYTNVGLLPTIVNANEPIINQIQVNLLGYLNTVLTGATGAANAAAAGVWNFPAAVIDATKLAFSGQVQEALAVLADAIVGPIVTAANDLFGAVGQVAASVVTRLVSVIKVIPTNLTLFGGWLIGGSAYLVEEAVAIGRQWLQDLGSGNIEAAWNTAVNGLLGPTGLPGSAFNVSLGAGVQTGPILNPQTDLKTNFIPSLRTAIQATLWNTQEALTATPEPKPAAVTPAPAAAELPTTDESPAAAELPATAPVTEEAPVDTKPVDTKVATAAEAEVSSDTASDNTAAPATRRAARAKVGTADSAEAPAKSHRAARATRASAGN